MIERFARVQTAARLPDIRRIAVLAALIATIAVVWHFARPAAIRYAAQKSLGARPREALIRAALNEMYPDLSEPSHESFRRYFWQPSSGSAMWSLDPIMESSGGSRWFVGARHVFVDGRLDLSGMIRTELPFASAPYSGRGDRLVIVLRYLTAPRWTRVDAICVVRLGAETNEIVGIMAYYRIPTASTIPRVYYGWRDEDGDGTLEFVLLGENLAMRTQSVTPTETLAVFRWDEEEKGLHMVRVPSDGSVIFWTPPDGQPHEFPNTAVLDEICHELLPLPDGFGLVAPPVTPPAPASTQSSQPAASPLPEPRP